MPVTPENSFDFSPHKTFLICQDCQKFRTQQCKYVDRSSDINLITSTDSACDEFLIKPEIDPFLEGCFNVKVFGDLLRKRFFFASQDENDFIWTYNSKTGVWGPNGAELIAEVTTGFMGKNFRREKIAEVKKYVQYTNFLKEKKFGGPAYKIVVKNGTFNLITQKLEPFHPEELHITRIPVKFDKNADCPVIKKFLFEIVAEKDVDKLIEFAGYCLYKEYPIARFIVLVGEGSNGKSTFLNLLKAFLGPENIAGLSLQQLSEPSGFTRARLFGKLANICGDIPAKALKDTGMLKTVTGRDLITADRKYKSMIEFVNYAKAIFSANQLPASRDESIAYHRRAVVIEFPNEFQEGDEKTDVNLDKKIQDKKELSGFFNLAIIGLQFLLTQGKFSNELTVEEKRLDYIKRSDPIQYFCLNFVREQKDNIVTKDTVYDYYVKMCHVLGHKPTSSNWFSQSFKRSVPFAEDTASRDEEKKKHRVWRGISIDLEKLNKEINENTVPKTNKNNIIGNGRNDRNDISLLLQTKSNKTQRNNKENTVPSVPTVPNNNKSGTIITNNIDELFKPLDKNEVLFKGQKESVKLPKRWYGEGDQ